MSNEGRGSAASARPAPQPTEVNPLDFVPDKMPFDTPMSIRHKQTNRFLRLQVRRKRP